MPKRTAAVFKYRGFRLLWRAGTGRWSVQWTEPECADGTGRKITRRESLGTADQVEATRALIAFADKRARLSNEPAELVTVQMIATRYYENHAIKLASAEAAYHHARHIINGLGGLALSGLTIDRQERFVVDLQERGLSNSYISRILSDLRAGIRRACKRQEIDRLVHVIDVPHGPGRDRVLDTAELGRLWALAAAEPHYVSMFLLLALGTGARPGTVLDLTRDQVNLDRGFIDLNPPRRTRTAKGRPIVPLAPVLRPWIATVASGHLVQLDGRPLADIKSAWRRLRDKAGLGDEVIPYTIRHTVATHLHATGVPIEQIAAFLGHSTGRRTTEKYLHIRPEHLGAARDAVQGLISETARVGARAVSMSLAG
jgi:integrase